ncbi:MAG: hypothetical protein WA947_08280 [Phormidesmis sp.]
MKASLFRSDSKTNTEPAALSHRCDAGFSKDEAFSINCLLRTVRFEESVRLLSRISYCFPPASAVSVSTAMQHANFLNRLLSQSQVHVVEDIDGAHGYFLQMDSVLQGDANPAQLSTFLSGVTEDIEAMLKYFQAEAYLLQAKSLSTVSEGCNTADLQTQVRTLTQL